jgi:hypothetical protein
MSKIGLFAPKGLDRAGPLCPGISDIDLLGHQISTIQNKTPNNLGLMSLKGFDPRSRTKMSIRQYRPQGLHREDHRRRLARVVHQRRRCVSCAIVQEEMAEQNTMR